MAQVQKGQDGTGQQEQGAQVQQEQGGTVKAGGTEACYLLDPIGSLDMTQFQIKGGSSVHRRDIFDVLGKR